MRTRVIPAQITTVEDKIAGNLNLTQMLILMAPVFFSTIIYVLLPPTMGIVWYKVTLSLVAFSVCGILALRIKGKVVVSWIAILLKYFLRPKYYVLNKNDPYLRVIELPKTPTDSAEVKAETGKAAAHKPESSFNIGDLVRLEQLLTKKNTDLRFKVGKNGGLNVAYQEIVK
jgi:hypothetical protein